MFCTKCGKEIEDNSTFCNFCGAPVNNVPNAAVNAAPQQTPVQNSTPQYNAGGVFQNDTVPDQPVSVSLNVNLDAKTIGLIRMILFGVLALLSVLVIIGSIGSMATTGTLADPKASYSAMVSAAASMKVMYYLARIPAIIAFSLSVLGLGFSIFTKQRSLFAYVSACAGVLMFIFNFVMYGGYAAFAKSFLFSSSDNIAGIIVSGIFLLISSLVMIGSSAIVILKKEDIVPFRPKF